ncbi:MAG: TIGR00282 family metallophosphoesterase [Acutalibacteraceae bacterium]
MRLLAVGDVCGSIGCDEVRRVLPVLKRDKKIDMTVINGENSADGNGILPESAESLFACGADVITGGNHTLRRKQVFDYLDENEFVLRPHNLPEAQNGKGICLVDLGYTTAAVINLCGTLYLEKSGAANPFKAADELVEMAREDGAKIIIVDFHAEATSEKRALALYLDGRASAFFGTHTHVQTADEQILNNGTGYITDLGMTGPIDSVLGVKSEIIINRLKDGNPAKIELADGKCQLCGCIFDIDPKTGRTVGIERIAIK